MVYFYLGIVAISTAFTLAIAAGNKEPGIGYAVFLTTASWLSIVGVFIFRKYNERRLRALGYGEEESLQLPGAFTGTQVMHVLMSIRQITGNAHLEPTILPYQNGVRIKVRNGKRYIAYLFNLADIHGMGPLAFERSRWPQPSNFEQCEAWTHLWDAEYTELIIKFMKGGEGQGIEDLHPQDYDRGPMIGKLPDEIRNAILRGLSDIKERSRA